MAEMRVRRWTDTAAAPHGDGKSGGGGSGGGSSGVVDAAALSPEARDLLVARAAARTAKDWPAADRARDRLAAEFGVRVEDRPDGTTVVLRQ